MASVDGNLQYRLRAHARRLNRLRWISKVRNLRRHPRTRGTVGDMVRYVAWAPEIGDYSQDVANLDELASVLATAFDVHPGRARELLEEPLHDAQLRRDYAAQRRAALLPRRLSIGHRTLWWAIVRLRQPRFVVETGIWYGLGALVLLRALERNEEEGCPPGQLLSLDPDPTAGWLVPARYRDSWTRVQGLTEQALAPSLRGREIDLFVHDTPATYEGEHHEVEVALAHAAAGAVLVSNNGTNTAALADVCADHQLPFHHTDVLPSRHWYVSNGVSFTIVSGG